MTLIKVFSRITLLAFAVIFFGSWNQKLSEHAVKRTFSCTLDIFAENNTSVVVDYVQFVSSLDTESLSNLGANGGTGSSVFEYDLSIGCSINIKMPAFPGTGRIKIYRGSMSNLVFCTNFINASTSITYVTPDDIGDSVYCPEAFFVFIETTSC